MIETSDRRVTNRLWKHLCSNEGLTIETSFYGVALRRSTYPNQPYVDTFHVVPLRRHRPKLVLTGTSIPWLWKEFDLLTFGPVGEETRRERNRECLELVAGAIIWMSKAGKYDIVYASAQSAINQQFLESFRKDTAFIRGLVACGRRITHAGNLD